MSLSKPVLTLNFSADNGCKYFAELDTSPFDKGCFRWAFMGKLYGVSGQEPRHNTPCVIKIFKNVRMNTFDNCFVDLKASIKAQEYAAIFNTLTNSNNVEFLIPLVVQIDSISVPSSYFTIGAYVSIEPLLIGTYQKFNTNIGLENSEHPLMSAFCHWTWKYSMGLHMVCDLQGVYTGEKYLLTDPVINSKNREFGITDLGPDGMKWVNINHKCNSKCYQILMTTMQTLTATFAHNMLPFSPMTQQLTQAATFSHNQHPFGLPTQSQTQAFYSYLTSFNPNRVYY